MNYGSFLILRNTDIYSVPLMECYSHQFQALKSVWKQCDMVLTRGLLPECDFISEFTIVFCHKNYICVFNCIFIGQYLIGTWDMGILDSSIFCFHTMVFYFN